MGRESPAPALLERIRRRRGYVLPAHEFLAEWDPAFLEAFDTFVDVAIGGTHLESPALPDRYRELVISAVLAFRGASTSGIARHLARAHADGATVQEMLEAFEAVVMPGGAPTFLRGVEALMELDTTKRS